SLKQRRTRFGSLTARVGMLGERRKHHASRRRWGRRNHSRCRGQELFEACQRLGGCDVGDAKITRGFRLKARYIIHAVGPIWRVGSHGEAQLLAACYRRSFELAAKHRITCIAFPSISTGAFGYPIELAAPIAVTEAQSFARRQIGPRGIIFCCFSSEDFDLCKTSVPGHSRQSPPWRRPVHPVSRHWEGTCNDHTARSRRTVLGENSICSH